MKPPLFLRKCSFLLFSLFTFYTGLSQFENTIGNLTGSDETTDIKPLPNGHTAVLANTTSFGSSKILIMELDVAGNVVFFKTLSDVANPAIEYSGMSLALDLDAAGTHVGYFITGCRGEVPTQMILIRTDVSGNPTWVRRMNNILSQNSIISECGISIEVQPNRDVIVIGRSDLMGNLRFTASRISSAGVLIWSFRYGSNTGLQFIPNESCNGKKGNMDAVTVVGHIHNAGIGHTFVSSIRAGNGQEFWRRRYDSDHDHDDGTDLVQDPATSRYMIVGHAENLAGGGTKMWVFNANGSNGGFVNGATYSLPAPYQNLFARDVCLSPDLVSATIAGFVDYETSFGPTETRTYIMKLPFAAGALPVFSHYFTESDPQLFLFGDDAIETFGGANPGYVLGTQAKLPGAAALDYDVHALRLNLLGMHNFSDCPVVSFSPLLNEEGRAINLKKENTAASWSNATIGVSARNYLEEPCDEILAPPPIIEIVNTPQPAFKSRIYPNPALAGTDINIEFELNEPSDVEIQLFDITGKLLSNWKEYKLQGKQVVQIPLATSLSDRMYLLRIIFPDGRFEVFRLLVE